MRTAWPFLGRLKAAPTLLVLTCALLAIAIPSAQQPGATTTFTPTQAASGRVVYDGRCASCHQADLRGLGRSAGAQWHRVPHAMAGRERRESERLRSELDATGWQSPDQQRRPQCHRYSSRVDQPASERCIAGTRGAHSSTGRDLTRLRRGEGSRWRGTSRTTCRSPRNMLRDPPAGDWLMARRTYQAWSYSPLADIKRENVGGLRLAWMWAMSDQDGANQPMPLVHNGIVYLVGTGDMIQALNGKTGDLIWESEIGPGEAVSMGSMRRTWRSTTTSCWWRRRTHGSSRSMRAAVRSHGKRHSKIAQRASATREDRSSRRAGRFRGWADAIDSGPSVVSSARTRRARDDSCGSSTPWPTRASAAATRGASCPTTSARAATPGLLAATIPI